jgi:hypothetical protein
MVKHVSETPTTRLLKAHKVVFTEHPYQAGRIQTSIQSLWLKE